MKRLNYFLVGLVTLVFVFTSCETDDSAAPVIKFTNEVNSGTTSDSTFTITGTITSEAGLSQVKYYKVTSAGEDQLDVEDKFSDKNSYSFQYTVNVSEDITVKVEATDKDNQTTSRNFTITYTGGALATVGTSQLGAGGNLTLGSYYSVAENKVYKSSDLTAHASKVDFVFDTEASTASIYSPSESKNSTLSATGRVTYFEKATFDFDAATVADVDAIDPTSKSVDVVLNDIVVYKTHDGLKGVFKVTDISVKDDGSVTISVKVKE